MIPKRDNQATYTGESNYDKVGYIPRDNCLKLASDIDYVGYRYGVNYFLLKSEGDLFGFVSEEDLVKYLPWLY